MKFFLCLLLCFNSWSLFAKEKKNSLKKITNSQSQTQKEASKSQSKINNLDDQTQKIVQDYRLTLKKTYNIKKYNEQLRIFIKNQRKEMQALRQQIEQVKDTRKEILPLMLTMVDSLDEFIELDLPFLLEKRKGRVATLKDIMKKSDVSVSEKYRRLLDIYEIEHEYGRTISAYKGMQKIKDRERSVNYLRVGRLALVYQSSNKKHLGYWDHSEKKWKKLSRSYKASISKALAIAKKQVAPDLIKVPISTPIKEAQP